MISINNITKTLIIDLFSKARKGSLLLTLPDGSTHHFGQLDSPPEVSLTVHDETFFKDLALGEDIGLGESYEAGKWDSDTLTGFIQWLLINKDSFADSRHPRISKIARLILVGLERINHFKNRNSVEQSRKNIQYHYDLGNAFYQTFLDPGMTYSSGFFSRPDQSLEDAQTEKYERLCQKLNLQPDHHILEIGTGWGGFAIHAASRFGCHVTTTTISQRQFEYATRKVREKGLDHLIDIRMEDYRKLTGKYDRIVSIEMLEAVGHRYLKNYFESCQALLKEDGLAAYQVILSSNSHYEVYRNRVDWIRKHIFPGGHLPSLNSITDSISTTGNRWDLYHCETFGLHYAKTLAEWRTRFNKEVDRLRSLGVSDSFIRKWNMYLSYCEAGFRERHVNVAQLVFGRSDIEAYQFECRTHDLSENLKAPTQTPQLAS